MYRLLSDHFEHFRGQYEDVFEHEYGRWRRVVDAVVGRFLDCGVLEAGFARVRCADCTAEYLLAFSCKTRYFCPSCHAKRLAAWTVWLDDELLAGPPHGLQAGWGALAPVPHRQMVFVLPKRLRPYFQWRRKLLGDLARVAARTATAFVRATLDEPDVSVGIVLCIQTHGSLLNWQPHIHALVTDGGFRPDGTFVSMPVHSTEILTEAFRRAMLKLFVDRKLFEPELADQMLEWMHSGFSVHDSVWLDQHDTAAQARLARYCARCPVSLERLEYDPTTGMVGYTSDKDDGPTAGRYTFEPTAFIARLVAHIPARVSRSSGITGKAQAGPAAPLDGDAPLDGAAVSWTAQ